MSFMRTRIREAFQAALMGLPTTGEAVFLARLYPLDLATLPALVIMTQEEEADLSLSTKTPAGIKLFCHLQLLVKAYAKGGSALDTQLEQIEWEVRRRLSAHNHLGGLVKTIQWLRTEMALDGSGEEPIGVAEMQFRLDYEVMETI